VISFLFRHASYAPVLACLASRPDGQARAGQAVAALAAGLVVKVLVSVRPVPNARQLANTDSLKSSFRGPGQPMVTRRGKERARIAVNSHKGLSNTPGYGFICEMTQQLPVLANLVRDNSELLLARWRALVRELESAKDLDIPTLNDHVPVLIVDIAKAFDRFGEVPSGPRDTPESVSPNAGSSEVVQKATKSADIHGVQRLHAGFDLEEVVAEYGIFRDVLIELLDENQLNINPARLSAINSIMDVAIARAVQTYAEHRADQLRQAHQEHLRFVTHDLRSPLQAISLAVARLELQSRLGEHDPAMSRLAGTLQRSSDRLLALVNEIMKADDGGDIQIASVREVELWVVVERLITELAPLAEQRAVQLSNEVADSTVVNFDPMMLERVLQNLISNAIAAASDGWVKISALNKSSQNWSMTVSNWPGVITDAQIAKLTGQDAASEPPPTDRGPVGHGLGIVRELCIANGAHVSVTQSVEDGVSIEISGSFSSSSKTG